MKEYNIHIPKGCGCQDVDIGSYTNQIQVPTPDHMLAIGQIGCYTFRPTTCIDRCMLPVIEALWERKVITTGCCCGHNKRDGYVGIYEP